MAYPIHPEMFDRTYNDWVTIDSSAHAPACCGEAARDAIHYGTSQDSNVLIMPGKSPWTTRSLQFELTR